MKKTYQQQVSLGQLRTTLIIAIMEFVGGFATNRVQAIVNIDSEDPEALLKEAAISKWELSGRAPINSNFVPNAHKGRHFTEEEIKSMTKTNNGYLLKVEVEEDVLAGEITHGAGQTVANDASDLLAVLRATKAEAEAVAK
jgi:hypothetical protein